MVRRIGIGAVMVTTQQERQLRNNPMSGDNNYVWGNRISQMVETTARKPIDTRK